MNLWELAAIAAAALAASCIIFANLYTRSHRDEEFK